VRPRIDLQVKFNFLETENGQNRQTKKVNDIDVKAILLPDPERDEDDLEEFEFDILYDSDKKLWTGTMVDGSYLITMKSHKFKEIN
jgi:hypothetical protein